jgi:F420-non-reducing hydrogenase iron-sulfur subunit
MDESFEPRIIAFLCNWCSYAGADNAGIARLQSPPNVLPIRVMCSGRVSPEMVLRAFRSGADGVLVLGCHIGDCHYIDGNHRTAKRMPVVRKLLGYVGINPERFRLDWVSSAEAPKFARVTTEFVEQVRALGPIADEVGGSA